MADVETLEKTEVATAPLKMFDVIFFNDDYTPMDFVIRLLSEVFKHNLPDSTVIMLRVHNEGSSVVGTFTYEVAETKKDICLYNAEQNNYPLRVEVRESTSSI